MPPRRAAEPWQRRPNALVVLSGVHATLPESEVRACAPCRVVARWQRLLLLETRFPESLHRLAYAALVLDFLGVGALDRLRRLRRRIGASDFAARQTQLSPFFRSYGMQPRKSRCLVNLPALILASDQDR